jgi:hypothetical protein
MITALSLLVALTVSAPAPPVEAEVVVSPAVEVAPPCPLPELDILTVTNNCFIRCDNGINLDTSVSSCQECAQAAYANCNQQGTYGGYFYGPGCSDFW